MSELSHGLPRLAASGHRIVRADTGTTVRLRGVNRSGLEYSEPGAGGFLEAAGLTASELAEMITQWNSSVIRLPFNQDWALHGRGGLSGEAYRAALDQVVEWAAALGAYTLLDLQWLDADRVFGTAGGLPNRVAPLPEEATIELWATLASRYRNETAVLFDLFNEPHDCLPDDLSPLRLIDERGRISLSPGRRAGAAEWLPWARKLVTVIRGEHPQSLIWVSGVDWGYDLRGVRLETGNIVYSSHVYPFRPEQEWWDRFAHAGADRPLFIAEWGGVDADVEWALGLLALVRAHACGWTAWSWTDRPLLVRDAPARDYLPTAFGEVVRRELLA